MDGSRVTRTRSLFGLLALALLVVPVLSLAGVGLPDRASAETPGSPYFSRTWQRTDLPVVEGRAMRTWMWGPGANTDVIDEEYAESPGNQRKVQYFDKSRMEITTPGADPDTIWYVTNGLLVNELVSGQMQIGHTRFDTREAAQINVAGDETDPDGPTYATFAGLRSRPPLPGGSTIIQRVERDGTVSDDPAVATFGVTAAQRVQEPGIDHQVASPFWEFMNASGVIVGEDGGYTEGSLFENPFYATGYPIAEPYWATVRVLDTPVYVLIQCFQRRCLTYTPTNADAWQVEVGNVGQHYYRWRYEQPEVSQFVSAANGGTVRLGDRVILTIPPSALANDSTITITQLTEDADGSDEGLVAISRRYRIIADGGEDVELSLPATLEVAYNPNRIPEGKSTDDVTLGWKTATSGGWQVEPSEVEADRNRVIAHPMHLSVWSAFVPAPVDVTPTATTCGNDVSAGMLSDPASVIIGQTITYTLTVDAGDCLTSPANATASINLPIDLEYINIVECSSTSSASTVTCSYFDFNRTIAADATIAPNDTLTLRFEARVPIGTPSPPATVEACATVFDGVASNRVCATTTISEGATAPSKVSEPLTISIDEQFTYVITFSTGPTGGVPGGVNDYLPSEVEFVAVRCFTQSGLSSGTCEYKQGQHLVELDIPELAPYDTLRLEIDVRYPPPLGFPISEIRNCAEIFDGSLDPKPACATTVVE